MTKAALFVGTYTRVEGHVPEGRGKGVYAFSLDLSSGELAPLKVTDNVGINPTFLTGSRSTLYVANECDEPSARDASQKTGFVASLAIGRAADGSADGSLTETSRQETHGTFPCHVALNSAQDFLTATNYGGGSVALYPINPSDGTLAPSSDLRAYPDSGSLVVPDRQEAAHVHSSTWVPGADFVVAADLGNDRVAQFQLDRAAKKLVPHAAAEFAARPAGSGPRHFAIHPSLKFAYVLGELGNSIGVHTLKDGALSPEAVQEVSTIPEGFTDWTLVADIHTSACGKYVFASNRGHDSIAVFKIADHESGALEFLERVPTRGKTPRAFLVVQDLVVVANQDSHSLQIFRFDSQTGKLSFSGHSIECDSPVSLFIAPQ